MGEKKEMKGKKKGIVIAAGVALALIAVVTLTLGKTFAEETAADVICQGVSVQDVDLSGMTKEAATEALQGRVNDLNQAVFVFTFGEEKVEIAGQDMQVKADVNATVDAAYAYGHRGNILERYKEMTDVGRDTVSVDMTYAFDEEYLMNTLTDAFADTILPAENARLEFEDGNFHIVEGVNGRHLNAEETIVKLNEALNGWDGKSGITVEVAAIEEEPEHTSAELQDIKDEIGVFETKYSLGDTSRNNNIANAASKINNSVVYPGEEFDTMSHLVPFTTDNGWSYAGAYLNGEVITDIGGGICQLSTTLYNAVLRAELEVTERHPHSMAVGYVPLSADAALNEGSKNFCFKNNTDYPVYIYAWASGGTIHVSIYGKETRDANRSIEFENEVLESYDPGPPIETVDESLPPDYRETTQSAHVGYSAKLWKKVYENGELVDTIQVNSSYYNASPERVKIGNQAAPEENPEGTEAPPEGGEPTTEAPPVPDPAQPAAPDPAAPAV